MFIARSREVDGAGAPNSSDRGNRRALWLFFCLAVIGQYDSFLLGKYALVPYADFMDSGFILNLKLHGDQLLKHGLFHWFQPLLGGMPSQASLQPPWNLRSFMAMVMPLWLVVALIKAAGSLMAGYGMYRLFRQYFGLEERIAFVGGVVFVLACPWAYNYLWLCYFPLSIVHVDELTDPETGIRGRLARLGLFLVMTLGSIPVFTLPGFSVAHACFVLLFDRSGRRWRHLAVVVMLWTGYALVYTPYFIGLLQYSPEVSRVYNLRYDGFWASVVGLTKVTSLIRDYPTMALGVFLLPALRWSSPARRAFGFAMVPFFLAAFVGSGFFVLFKDTLVARMDLGHAIQVFYFGGVLMIGLGLQAMCDRKYRPNLFWALGAVLFLRLYCNEAQMLLNGVVMALVLISVFYRPGRGGRHGMLVLAGAAACLVFSVLIIKQREELKFTHVPFARSFGEYGVLNAMAEKAKGLDFRVACLDVHPSVARYAGLDTVGGRYVLTNRYYKEYLAESMRPMLGDGVRSYVGDHYDAYTTPREDNRDDLLYESFYPERKRTIADWNMPMLLALGVEYVVTAKQIDGLDQYCSSVMIDQGVEPPAFLAGTRIGKHYALPLRIHALRKPYGLARLVSSVRRFGSRQEVLRAMGTADEDAMRSSLFLFDGDISENASGGTGGGRIVEVHRQADVMTVAGVTDGPGYVLLAVNFDPHWTCTSADGELEIIRANHAFQAVRIDKAGPFRLRFSYADPLIDLAYLGSVLGVLLMLGTLFSRIPSGGSGVVSEKDGLLARADSRTGLWVVSGGIGASLVWALGYYLFIYRRYEDVPFASFGYLLPQLTVMGLLLSVWLWFACVKK